MIRGASVRGAALAMTSAAAAGKWNPFYTFNGSNGFGVLQSRVVDVEGDNALVFFAPTSGATSPAIVAQNISGNEPLQEFRLSATAGGALVLVFGGSNTVIATAAQGFILGRRYSLQLEGTVATLRSGGVDGPIVRQTPFTRGAAREPTAQTLVGARGNGAGVRANFFVGPQFNLEINGVTWPMSERLETLQGSAPGGNIMTLVGTSPAGWSKEE